MDESIEVRVYINKLRYELFETFASVIPDDYSSRYPERSLVFIGNKVYIYRPAEILFYKNSHAGFYNMDRNGVITKSEIMYTGSTKSFYN